MRGHFHPIAAEAHTAPLTGMVLRRIVKIQDAGLISALLHEREIFVAQQIAGNLGQKCQDLSGTLR